MPILRNFHLEAELAASTWDMAASGDLLNLDMNSATLTMKRHITCLHFEDDTSKADLRPQGPLIWLGRPVAMILEDDPSDKPMKRHNKCLYFGIGILRLILAALKILEDKTHKNDISNAYILKLAFNWARASSGGSIRI